MPKKLKTIIKLQIPAGAANPAPPVGPALGQHGLNIQEFCAKFNDATKSKSGDIVPVEINVYDDHTYDFKLKTSPAAELLKKAAGIKSGSSKPLQEKVGKVTKAQIREIAQQKLEDLNTDNIEAAMKIIEGTARQMGLTIQD
jgi:large subunit ribosomal protein L11